MEYRIKGRKIILSETPIYTILDGLKLYLKPHWAMEYELPITYCDLHKGQVEYELLRGLTKRDIIMVEVIEGKLVKATYSETKKPV